MPCKAKTAAADKTALPRILAELLEQLIPGPVTPGQLEDGLPLYRQAALLGRFGGSDISRNTLAASVVRVGQAVQPVINLLRDLMLETPLIFGDETQIEVLKEAGKSAQSKGYMWVQMTEGSGPEGTGPPIRLFVCSPIRLRAAPRPRSICTPACARAPC